MAIGVVEDDHWLPHLPPSLSPICPGYLPGLKRVSLHAQKCLQDCSPQCLCIRTIAKTVGEAVCGNRPGGDFCGRCTGGDAFTSNMSLGLNSTAPRMFFVSHVNTKKQNPRLRSHRACWTYLSAYSSLNNFLVQQDDTPEHPTQQAGNFAASKHPTVIICKKLSSTRMFFIHCIFPNAVWDYSY